MVMQIAKPFRLDPFPHYEARIEVEDRMMPFGRYRIRLFALPPSPDDTTLVRARYLGGGFDGSGRFGWLAYTVAGAHRKAARLEKRFNARSDRLRQRAAHLEYMAALTRDYQAHLALPTEPGRL